MTIKQKILNPNILSSAVVVILLGTIGVLMMLTSHASQLPGDANSDGVVNISDLAILAAHYGISSGATWSEGDFNSDGAVNIDDLSILAAHWGETTGAPTTGGCTNAGIVAPCIGSPTTGAAGWGTPVFDDEFNGTSLDTTKWSSSWFNGGTMNNVSTSASNVSVSGGDLILTLASSSSGALVSTNPNGGAGTGFQFGDGYYVEASIYFPGSGSTIYNWPAFWADGQSWPADGEDDIAEGLGTLTSNYHSTLGANNSGTIAGTWSSGWHTYGMDRENGINYIYWDGQLVRQYATDDSGSPQYLIINVGSGNTAVYGNASQVMVDYVRVWQ